MSSGMCQGKTVKLPNLRQDFVCLSDWIASSNITTRYVSLIAYQHVEILHYCVFCLLFLGIKHECQANGPEDLNRACIAEKLGGSLVVAFEGSPV